MENLDRVKAEFGERVSIIADLIGGQAELSRRTGLSENTITSYKKGQSPKLENLVAMAEAANVSLDWLAAGKGEMRVPEGQAGMTLVEPEVQKADAAGPQRLLGLVDASGYAVTPQTPDPEQFGYVPMVETQLSASGGCFVLSEDVEGYYAFRKSWISRVATSHKNLVLMRVQGSSMSPTIISGDTVMIDTGRRSIKEGLIYALRFDATVMIKRLSFRPGGRIQVISDNRQEYAPFETDMGELYVIGQIIFFQPHTGMKKPPEGGSKSRANDLPLTFSPIFPFSPIIPNHFQTISPTLPQFFKVPNQLPPNMNSPLATARQKRKGRLARVQFHMPSGASGPKAFNAPVCIRSASVIAAAPAASMIRLTSRRAWSYNSNARDCKRPGRPARAFRLP